MCGAVKAGANFKYFIHCSVAPKVTAPVSHMNVYMELLVSTITYVKKSSIKSFLAPCNLMNCL